MITENFTLSPRKARVMIGTAHEDVWAVNEALRSPSRDNICSSLVRTIRGELWKESGFESFAHIVYDRVGWNTDREFIAQCLRDAPAAGTTVRKLLTDELIAPYVTIDSAAAAAEALKKRYGKDDLKLIGKLIAC